MPMIPKIDFGKLTKVSFFDFFSGDNKGTKLSLEMTDEVLTAIEKLDLPRREDSAEPEDAAEWKEWNDRYEALYDRLNDIGSNLNMIDRHCRQNNEMFAAWDKLRERYERLRELHGEHSSWC